MDSLREKIANVVASDLGTQISGLPWKLSDELTFRTESGTWDLGAVADAILALPEMEALRLKPIKTMPVR